MLPSESEFPVSGSVQPCQALKKSSQEAALNGIQAGFQFQDSMNRMGRAYINDNKSLCCRPSESWDELIAAAEKDPTRSM